MNLDSPSPAGPMMCRWVLRVFCEMERGSPVSLIKPNSKDLGVMRGLLWLVGHGFSEGLIIIRQKIKPRRRDCDGAGFLENQFFDFLHARYSIRSEIISARSGTASPSTRSGGLLLPSHRLVRRMGSMPGICSHPGQEIAINQF